MTLVVAEGNNDNGSDMHPTIGELAPPTLTATAIPATNSKETNNDGLELLNICMLTGIWPCQW